MGFKPIKLLAYVELHMKSNPSENRDALTSRLREALAARRAGRVCRCGEPIWVLGSAEAGYGCFTCITGEACPESDFEIRDE